MTLVRGMVEYELGGSARFDSEPGGFTCTLVVPSDRLLGGEPLEVARALTET